MKRRIMTLGVLMGCGPLWGATSGTLDGKLQWVTPDFFIQTTDHKIIKENKLGDENCREKISKVVCLVDPVNEGDMTQLRPCLAGGQTYAKPFQDLYDHLPQAIQKMFCSLSNLYIEKELVPTAYAGLSRDSQGNVSGAVMGIRKSLLDERLTLAHWASWKEQLSFGGSKDVLTVAPDLPWILTESDSSVYDLLYVVVTHEFGHLFDFSNHLNKKLSCTKDPNDPEDEICEMAPESFGAISWKTTHSPRPENEFLNRNRLCFYRCENGTINRNEINDLYRNFYEKTNFISLYSTTQPWDDLADSMAYYLMASQIHATYKIDTKQGVVWDMMQKLRSNQFLPKVQYLENFLKRDDIQYP